MKQYLVCVSIAIFIFGFSVGATAQSSTPVELQTQPKTVYVVYGKIKPKHNYTIMIILPYRLSDEQSLKVTQSLKALLDVPKNCGKPCGKNLVDVSDYVIYYNSPTKNFNQVITKLRQLGLIQEDFEFEYSNNLPE